MKKNTGNREKYERRQRMKYIISWVAEIAAAAILAVFFSLFYCKSVVIQEGSMEPTLQAGQKVLYDSVSYSVSVPKRGDIIVFRVGDDQNASYHIKRIVGLPGETVQIINGSIYINGDELMEAHTFPEMVNAGSAVQPITLSDEQYFVLGDNRNNSEDSRYVGIGLVKEDHIIGKLWFILSPKSDFGFLND